MKRIPKVLIVALLFLLNLFPSVLSGHTYTSEPEGQVEEPEEVFLSFNYKNLFNKVIIAQYENGTFYLPVSEIFTSLKIPHEVDLNPPVITGSFLDVDNTFTLDFQSYTAQLDSEGSFSIGASDMKVGELDFFVTPELLQKVFGLNFTVDFNNLLLQLETENTMPVLAEFERAQERDSKARYSFQTDYYPLEFNRDRKMLSGGFLDYSLSANLNEDINIYTYNLDLGTELLGGDLQGNAFGNATSSTSNFITNNLRWRYVWRENNKLTQFYLGQTVSDGLINRNFVGIRATNEPIEPRYIYDQFEVEGDALPGSEVELYFNDALYDYQEITQNGQYRFLAPLTYGSSRLRLRIYDPAGGVREQTRRIQVPFNYLPTGELNYHINAGRVDNPIFGSTQRSNILQGDVAYGISNWLTQKVGVEYLDEFSDQTPLFYSTTSARLLEQYLVSFDVAPTAFYRASASAIYASSASWDVEYSYYDNSGIYNILGNDHEIFGNIFLPFSLFNRPSNIRLVGNHSITPSTSRTRYSVDLNTRMDRLNLRFRYSDNQSGPFVLQPSLGSELSTSATYFVSRSAKLPRAMQGMFLRGELSYNPNLTELNQIDLQVSRSIFENGRIQASASRNFIGNFNLLSLGLTIDFKATRTTSTARSTRNGASFSQNVLGSIGFDDQNKKVIFANRQQVGRSATSVRLFVDNNNSGFYDEGDEIVEENAVRIGRSGVTNLGRDGIVHISQLQSYNRINMEINRSAIENPLLIPELEKFSLVTDPNRYKPIDIPFYRSGVISGIVVRQIGSAEEPQSGLRLYLSNENDNFQKELRTFNDGSFYAYEIPPGKYNLSIDKNQLEFLNSVSEPDTLEVIVEAKADGDFVENLNFIIKKSHPLEEPISEEKTDPKIKEQPEGTDDERKHKSKNQLKIQLGSFQTLAKSTEALNLARDQFPKANLIFNTNTNMFSLRSDTLQQFSNIPDSVQASRSHYFNNPSLLVTSISGEILSVDSVAQNNPHLAAFKDKMIDSTDLRAEDVTFTYRIHIYNVSDQTKAGEYSDFISKTIGKVKVNYLSKDELITLSGLEEWNLVIEFTERLNNLDLKGIAIPVLDITGR